MPSSHQADFTESILISIQISALYDKYSISSCLFRRYDLRGFLYSPYTAVCYFRAVCQIQYFQPRSNLVFNIGGTFFREIHSKKQHGRNIREFSGTRPHRTESHRKQNNKEKKLHLKMESIIRNTLFNLQFKTPNQIARRILSDRLRYDYFYSVSSFFHLRGRLCPIRNTDLAETGTNDLIFTTDGIYSSLAFK